MAKFGQLLFAKGDLEWRTVDPEKLDRTGDSQADSERERNPRPDGADWQQGYGFQFWRCRYNAFRADGAAGQFIVVMPDQDSVVAITADSDNMQAELDAIWDHLLPGFRAAPLPADAAGQEKLKQAVDNLVAHPKKKDN